MLKGFWTPRGRSMNNILQTAQFWQQSS